MNIHPFRQIGFQQELRNELESFIYAQEQRFPMHENLKIDLHCHDHNSDVPDELLGRILRVPETWLSTKKLIKQLKKNGSDLITITNHNNARSCWELQEKGYDVLVGSEFSCYVPDFEIGIHVLTYGFTKEQEKILNKLRKNLYQFLQYCRANDIPTIWAHPLYHYSTKGIPPFEFLRKLSVVFERFEVINGQRDTWQNMLVKNWIEGLTPTIIDKTAKEFNVDINQYCKNIYRKSFSGGSDSHMGIFAGQTGTFLHIPNLKEAIKTNKPSELALEAIKNGKMAPYGTHHNSEKLTIAFLDYVFQIAMHKKDPGLMRIMLHKGSSQDKLLALFISNAFSELKRHKVTMRFVELFHECFIGKTPKKSQRFLLPKEYKPIFDQATKIAEAHNYKGEDMVTAFDNAIKSISQLLNNILFSRLVTKINNLNKYQLYRDIELIDIIEKLEFPSEIRSLISNKKKFWSKKKGMVHPNLAEFSDGLPFPFLASALILGANFTSSKVLYNSRPLLKTFANKIGKLEHPQRMLWLTDTFEDKNGVSMVLNEMHKEIKLRNLPIDIIVCSKTIQPDDHLIVVEPLAEFDLPFYKDQKIRIPNLHKIHDLFLNNEYDRIMCSTEGVMGAIALYLKNAYSVPASFYIHTDWVMFARKVLKLDTQNIDRIRRMLRAYYSAFDNLFVLNTDHQKWLTGTEMGFNVNKVLLTAHWADEKFKPTHASKSKLFGIKETDKVLLFAGRLSKEKGVYHLADIYDKVKKEIPDVKFVFAGTGPEEENLRKQIPDGIFLGWLDNDKLPDIYSAADLLSLPSKFDTFSCVVLESLCCGTPVVAYKAKGPKDIIDQNNCGYLASGKKDMSNFIIDYFNDETNYDAYKQAALTRSKMYKKDVIVDQLLQNVGLIEDC